MALPKLPMLGPELRDEPDGFLNPEGFKRKDVMEAPE